MQQTVNWHDFWKRDKPGFHEGRVNRYLKNYLNHFSLQTGDGIFMPLCGKAVDILWLSQQGYHVYGVELSRVAVESFFKESGITPEMIKENDFTVYRSKGITLYQGDYLDLTSLHLPGIKLVYDRASLVAIESFNRSSYVSHMFSLIPQTIPMLLITLVYDQQKMTGPPFSVPVNEIAELYSERYQVELLEQCEQVDEGPKWRERGLHSLLEIALKLSPA